MTNTCNLAKALRLAVMVALGHYHSVAAQTPAEIAPAQVERETGDDNPKRHQAFRRQHNVRLPHPRWFNSLLPAAEGGSALTLAEDYQARYAILLPAEPAAEEKQAAAELALWLKALSGAEFDVVVEGPAVGARPVISIGRTKLAQAAHLKAVDFQDGGYRIAVVNGNILLSGGRHAGILNAVYALLEEDLGCRWYQPGTYGAVIPLRVDLSIQPASRVFVPPFDRLRRVDYGDVINDGDWQRRNRARFGNVAKVHSYQALVSPELFDAHPDYFALQAGKRSIAQICPSHPDVRQIVLQNVGSYLADRPDAVYIDISPNDGGGACECLRCQAIVDREEGVAMGPLLELVNFVADHIAGDHPHLRVTTLAYLNTVVPPKTFGPAGNVITWLATDAHAWSFGDLFIWETNIDQRGSALAMQQWHDRWQAPLFVWDYPSFFHEFGQYNLNLPVIADNLKWYAQRGAVGIYFQTQHHNNSGFPQSYQRSWIFAKLGWDPARNTRDLVRDFNYGFYGAAAPAMQAFDDMLWETWQNWYGTHVAGTLRPWTTDRGSDVEFPGRVELNELFWLKAEELLLTAATLADNPDLKQRIAVARLPLMYRQLEQGPQASQTIGAFLSQVDEFESVARSAGIQYIEGMAGPYVPGGTLQPKLDYWRSLAAPPADTP